MENWPGNRNEIIPPCAQTSVDASRAGALPISTVGAPIRKEGATAGTQGLGGLDILHTPNDGILIDGLRSRTVAAGAPPASTPFPGGTENSTGAPAWLPEQTTIALEQISFATVCRPPNSSAFSARQAAAPWLNPREPAIPAGNAAAP